MPSGLGLLASSRMAPTTVQAPCSLTAGWSLLHTASRAWTSHLCSQYYWGPGSWKTQAQGPSKWVLLGCCPTLGILGRREPVQTLPWCAWNTLSNSLSASCPSACPTLPYGSLPTLTAGLQAGAASVMECPCPALRPFRS
ncbi:hypothetical protein LEMLEM_LOCUS26051 [Lemmus lemmus]